MSFDADKASTFVINRDDRDIAPFFAGRRDEIQHFERAVEQLDTHGNTNKRVLFRIYQGPPGCGKTSLIEHLRTRLSDRLMFVDINPDHLASTDSLMKRVRNEAVGAGPLGSKIAAKVAEAMSVCLRLGGTGKEVQEHIADRSVKDMRVILHLDEAQRIGPAERPVLLNLHTTGLGVPSILVMTGLDHTVDKVAGIGGLSRLSRNSVMNMGAMKEEECAASTLMMLNRFHVDGDEQEKAQATEKTAHLSRGWPQHLNGAQVALCRELIRTDGALRDVDTDRIRSESDQGRYEYYLARLTRSALAIHPPLTMSVIIKMNERPPSSIGEFGRLCRREMERSGWIDDPNFAQTTPEIFASTLIEKGVVSITLDGCCKIPIPSMADWAASKIDAEPSSTPPRTR